MPLRSLSKNKLLLQKHFNVSEFVIDMYPFWMLEENISIINEIMDDENKNQEQQKEQYGDIKPPSIPNSGFDFGSINNMMNSFRK